MLLNCYNHMIKLSWIRSCYLRISKESACNQRFSGGNAVKVVEITRGYLEYYVCLLDKKLTCSVMSHRSQSQGI